MSVAMFRLLWQNGVITRKLKIQELKKGRKGEKFLPVSYWVQYHSLGGLKVCFVLFCFFRALQTESSRCVHVADSWSKLFRLVIGDCPPLCSHVAEGYS